MIKELCQWIEDQAIGLTVGTNLYVDFRPQNTPKACVVVINRGGKPEYQPPNIVARTVQVLVRDKDSPTAYEMANEVYQLLHGRAKFDLPVITTGEIHTIYTIDADSIPQSVGQDENGLFEFSTNFTVYSDQ